MTNLTETVREIALAQPHSIRVFERFGIDYCCGGRKPLAEACVEKQIAVGEVVAALEAARRGHCGLAGGLVTDYAGGID